VPRHWVSLSAVCSHQPSFLFCRNQESAMEQLATFSKSKASTQKKRETKKIGTTVMYLSDPKNLERPCELKPK